ncbi:MAG: biotin-dependent carboxyltransferase family protein [Bacteroidetes bacterium]|nr:biotin-dependent carboxyltransferase family protein [Bacteroidota bacterium]
MTGQIKFISGGMLTSIQDMGRYGHQKFGMPVSGAMDTYSLQLANYLVGNKRNEACFEITYLGPEIEFHSDTTIAISGAIMQSKVNGSSVPMNTSIFIAKGDILVMGAVKKGMRAYLSIAGGVIIPDVMGSRSTYLRAKVGGFQGRKIETGDLIEIGKNSLILMKEIPSPLLFIYPGIQTIRVLKGTEFYRFENEAWNTFLNSEYTISNQNDRMGYRLSGPPIKHKNGADIISSGIVNGSIQVPGHGEPIIMMADHQTVGGYTKIANVVSVDLPIMGQMKAGDKIKFKEITLEEAQDLIKKQEENLVKLFNL